MTATHSIGPQASVDHFDDEFCGIAFDIPTGWQIISLATELYPEAQCSFGIRPSDWQAIVEQSEAMLDDYPVLVLTYSLPFEAAAVLTQFTLLDGAWFIEGRGIEEAQPIQAGRRTILRGEAWYAVYTRANASYAGVNTVMRAVLNEGGPSSVVAHTIYYPIGGTITLYDAFELILRTSSIPEPGS